MTSTTANSIILGLATALFLIAPVSAQAPACGDCDGDGVISILDALAAAQYQLGMGAIPEANLDACNTFEDDHVNIIDVLLIARQAVGQEGAVTQCYPVDTQAQINPITNLQQIQPVTENGYTNVDFMLANPLYEPTVIEVFFSLENGVYFPATPAPQQPVNGAFATTSVLMPATFVWDSLTDLPASTESLQLVIVRVQTYSIHESTQVPGEYLNLVYSY